MNESTQSITARIHATSDLGWLCLHSKIDHAKLLLLSKEITKGTSELCEESIHESIHGKERDEPARQNE